MGEVASLPILILVNKIKTREATKSQIRQKTFIFSFPGEEYGVVLRPLLQYSEAVLPGDLIFFNKIRVN